MLSWACVYQSSKDRNNGLALFGTSALSVVAATTFARRRARCVSITLCVIAHSHEHPILSVQSIEDAAVEGTALHEMLQRERAAQYPCHLVSRVTRGNAVKPVSVPFYDVVVGSVAFGNCCAIATLVHMHDNNVIMSQTLLGCVEDHVRKLLCDVGKLVRVCCAVVGDFV